MYLRMKNTANHELPVTITNVISVKKSVYPGLIHHRGETLDYCLWGYGDTLLGVLLHLATSDDFMRDVLAGTLTTVGIGP